MISLTSSPEFWYWWVLATVFFGLEILAPGAFLLWLGFAATISGFIVWAFPGLDVGMQLAVFSVLSMALIFIWYRFFKGISPRSSQPYLNNRAAGLIGTHHQLVKAIHQGVGKIKVHDSFWSVKGPDLPKGHTVKVVGHQDSYLHVEPVLN